MFLPLLFLLLLLLLLSNAEVLAWKVASSDSWDAKPTPTTKMPVTSGIAMNLHLLGWSLAIGPLGTSRTISWIKSFLWNDRIRIVWIEMLRRTKIVSSRTQFLCHKWFLKAKPTMTGLHTSCNSSEMDTSHTRRIPISQEFPAKINHSWGMLRFTKKSTSFAAIFRDARIYCTALSIWPPSFLLPRKSRMGVEGWWKVDKLELSRVNWLGTDSRAISSQVPL